MRSDHGGVETGAVGFLKPHVATPVNHMPMTTEARSLGYSRRTWAGSQAQNLSMSICFFTSCMISSF
jgi:hypothetical protein